MSCYWTRRHLNRSQILHRALISYDCDDHSCLESLILSTQRLKNKFNQIEGLHSRWTSVGLQVQSLNFRLRMCPQRGPENRDARFLALTFVTHVSLRVITGYRIVNITNRTVHPTPESISLKLCVYLCWMRILDRTLALCFHSLL